MSLNEIRLQCAVFTEHIRFIDLFDPIYIERGFDTIFFGFNISRLEPDWYSIVLASKPRVEYPEDIF